MMRFASHLVYQNESLIISDQRDPRFAHLPSYYIIVLDYAGLLYAIVMELPWKFCVLDREPQSVTEDDMNLLKGLAADLMQTLSNENCAREKLKALRRSEDS